MADVQTLLCSWAPVELNQWEPLCLSADLHSEAHHGCFILFVLFVQAISCCTPTYSTWTSLR